MGKRARRKRRAMKRLAEQRYDNHPRYYLAYGSNHNMGQMRWRCKDAEPLARVFLQNWKLVFSGVLTIEPEEGRVAPLSVWKVSATDIISLDSYEGYPHLYSKMFLQAEFDGESHKAFTYILNKPYSISPPAFSYYKGVREGYVEWGFDIEPLETASAEAYEEGVYTRKSFDDSYPKYYGRGTGYKNWIDYVECEVCGHWFPPDEVVRTGDNTYACWECSLGDKWKPEYDDEIGNSWPKAARR